MTKEIKVKNFIGGKWVASTSEKVEPVYNPATGEVIAEVPLSTTAELDEAVQVADKAFQDWRKKPVPQREIGRASCRERGKNAVEAGASTKTITTGKWR